MNRKTSAYYQRLHRDRLREKGLIKKELWILPEYTDELLWVEKRMRQPRSNNSLIQQEMGMSDSKIWSATTLYDALNSSHDVQTQSITLELLQGTESSLHLVMHDYGDLPLFLAIVGGQIIIEALLWPVSQVMDPHQFNENILYARKLFTLSTIGIEKIDNDDVYVMYGALSANSSLENILFEIETLSDNVIKATEAFESQLVPLTA